MADNGLPDRFPGLTTAEVRELATHAAYDHLPPAQREAARLEVYRRERLKINYVPLTKGSK